MPEFEAWLVRENQVGVSIAVDTGGLGNVRPERRAGSSSSAADRRGRFQSWCREGTNGRSKTRPTELEPDNLLQRRGCCEGETSKAVSVRQHDDSRKKLTRGHGARIRKDLKLIRRGCPSAPDRKRWDDGMGVGAQNTIGPLVTRWTREGKVAPGMAPRIVRVAKVKEEAKHSSVETALGALDALRFGLHRMSTFYH